MSKNTHRNGKENDELREGETQSAACLGQPRIPPFTVPWVLVKELIIWIVGSLSKPEAEGQGQQEKRQGIQSPVISLSPIGQKRCGEQAYKESPIHSVSLFPTDVLMTGCSGCLFKKRTGREALLRFTSRSLVHHIKYSSNTAVRPVSADLLHEIAQLGAGSVTRLITQIGAVIVLVVAGERLD